jgi:hypothetical protein
MPKCPSYDEMAHLDWVCRAQLPKAGNEVDDGKECKLEPPESMYVSITKDEAELVRAIIADNIQMRKHLKKLNQK